MLRAMYSAISGMRGFQTKLDVIGNNIANVNTPGFKAGRVMFSDLLSQTIQGASAPSTNLGGINPKQVGLGSKISSIDTIFTDGSIQSTSNPTDLAIQGNGFFILKDKANNTYYTRAGNFKIDKDGYLVASNGMYVQGAAGKIQIPAGATSFSIGNDGVVSYITNGNSTPQTIDTIQLATFSNPAGLVKVGDSMYQQSNNSGTAQVDNPGGSGGQGTIISSALEMSNVDLANEFTEMIVAQRGFQANSRIITTSDDILQELVNLKRS
jgi:flagellar hook protein FlgE